MSSRLSLSNTIKASEQESHTCKHKVKCIHTKEEETQRHPGPNSACQGEEQHSTNCQPLAGYKVRLSVRNTGTPETPTLGREHRWSASLSHIPYLKKTKLINQKVGGFSRMPPH